VGNLWWLIHCLVIKSSRAASHTSLWNGPALNSNLGDVDHWIAPGGGGVGQVLANPGAYLQPQLKSLTFPIPFRTIKACLNPSLSILLKYSEESTYVAGNVGTTQRRAKPPGQHRAVSSVSRWRRRTRTLNALHPEEHHGSVEQRAQNCQSATG
jgi:hypothetical protein